MLQTGDQLPDGNFPLLGSLVGVPGHEETVFSHSRSDLVKQLAHTAIVREPSNAYNRFSAPI
jgi:hypothetical protein